jgi:hypothetical protein
MLIVKLAIVLHHHQSLSMVFALIVRILPLMMAQVKDMMLVGAKILTNGDGIIQLIQVLVIVFRPSKYLLVREVVLAADKYNIQLGVLDKINANANITSNGIKDL